MNKQNHSSTPIRTRFPRVFASFSTTAWLAVLALLSVSPLTLRATSDAWDGSTDGVWATGANWLTDPAVVPGAGETATFNSAGNGNTTINLGGGVTISNVLFDSASAASFTIGSGGVGSQTLTLGSPGNAIGVNSGVANNQLFNANLGFSTTGIYNVRNDSANSLTIAGGLSATTTGVKVLSVDGAGATTILGAITSGTGTMNLVKTNSGTLTLSGGARWEGNGVNAYLPGSTLGPVVLRQGTTIITGGIYTNLGEFVLGGTIVNGGAGYDTKLIMTGGSLGITAGQWFSVGKGNGVGGVSSDVVLSNNAIVLAPNFSLGWNQNQAANLPKGSVTLNNSSSLRANGNFYIGESPGADMTLTVNDSAGVTNVNSAGIRVSSSGKGNLIVNGGTVRTEGDLTISYSSTLPNLGRVVVNGGNLHVATTTKRWLLLARSGNGGSEMVVSNGAVHVNANTDIRFSTLAAATGTNTLTLKGGSITFYSDNATTVGGSGVIDLQQGGAAATYNTFNLDGGTLTVPGVLSAQTSGTRIFNFNGGTLKPTVSSPTFFNLGTGNARANVRDGGAVIDTAGFNITIAQTLVLSDVVGDSGTGGLTKTGNGTLTLGGGYTYTGPTLVRGGTLSLDAVQSTPSPAGNLTVSNASLTLSLNSGASSLPAGNVTLQGSSVLNLNYGTVTATPFTAVNATGGLVQSGSTVINITASGLGTGVFPLITYTGSTVPTNNFTLGTLPPGIVAVLTNNTPNTLDLLVTGAGQLLTWYGADSAGTPLTTWDIGSSSNWNSGNSKYLQYSGNTYGDNVTFDDSLFGSSGTNVTLNATVVPATVTFNSSLPYTITGSGRIAGVTAFVVTNTGSVFLGMSNTYSGGTIIGGGRLIITNDAALGTNGGAVTMLGGSLQLNGSLTSSRSVAVTGGASIGVGSGFTPQFNGIVSGTAVVTKTDNGKLTLTASNTYSGSTVIKAGTLAVSSGVTGSTNADIQIAPEFGDAGTLEISGGTVNASRVIIGGNSPNTGSPGAGTVNQSGGTINSRQWFTVGSGANAGGSCSGTYNFSGGTLNIHSQQMEVGNFTATDGTVNLSGTAALNLWNNSYLTLGANNDANSGTFNQNGGTVTFYSDAGVTAGGNGILFIGRAGILSGTFTYNLNNGTLIVPQIQGTVTNAATRVFNFNGGTLRATKANPTFLSGLTTANVQAGGAIIDASSNNITISQALLDGGAGGGLTKHGSGTLTLTGADNYTGPTVVNAGSLLVTPQHQAGGAISVAGGAAYGIIFSGPPGASTNSGSFTLGAGATTLSFGLGTNGNATAPMLVTGAFTNNGTLSVLISGSVGKLSVGVMPLLKYGAGSVVGTLNPAITGPQGSSITLSNGVGSATLYAVITSTGSGITWTGTNPDPARTNLWDLNSTTNWVVGASPTIYSEITPPGDAVNFTDSGSGLVLLSNTVSPASVTISNVVVNYTFQGPGHLSGATGLTKTGTGSALISYPGNDYTGATVINNGSLVITGGSAIGNASAVTLANVAGASLVVSNSEIIGSLAGGGAAGGNVKVEGELTLGANNTSTTYGGAVSGPGRFILNGTGSLTVTGSVAAGNEIWIGGVSATNTPTLNLQSGAMLTSSNWLVLGRDGATGTITINGGTMIHNGVGNLTLGTIGANPTGILNLNSGTISNLAGETWLGEGNTTMTYGYYNQAGGNAYLGNFMVGRGNAGSTVNTIKALGVATITGGTVTAGNFYVGHGGQNGQGVGTATITGGTSTFNAANIEVGYGYNNTREGTNTLTLGAGAVVTSAGYVRVGYAGSANMWGLLTNNGGTLNIGATALYLGFWDPCNGEVTHNSGQINLRNNAEIRFGENSNNSGVSTFNQNGGNVTFYGDGGTNVGGTGSLNLGNAGTGTYTYNLNGGTLTVPRIRKAGGTGTGTFNFKGGTVKAAASSATFLEGLTAANVMASGATIDSSSNSITINQPLLDGDSLGGGLIKQGAGSLFLNGASTYTGATVVSNGTLGGLGTLTGPVVVTTAGRLAPGAGLGTLTINNHLTLAGSLAVDVNTAVSPSNDLCVVTGGLTNTGTGTVFVTNLGPALVVGDTFQLFSQPVVNGHLLNVTGGGVVWTNKLAANGTISVLSVPGTLPTTPTNLTFSASGGMLMLSWPSNYTGWILQSQTNSRSIGLTPASNTWFDVPGSSALSTTNFPVVATNPTVFFRLRLP